MTESQYKDLTRKAMIREYLLLRNNTISLIDATNELYGFIEENFEEDDEFKERLDNYDQLVDNINL
jgi:hypothetical protein